MIELYSSPEECCGCSACASICPQAAISFKDTKKGFLYPETDESKCVECGLCIKACDFKKFKPTGKKPDTFAVRHKDENEVATSRSGAVFAAMCKEITARGGVCFGCELDQELTVVHKMEESYEGCLKYKGSKYVQSDMKDCFKQCEEQLQENKWVLFSGTGCQTHGLLTFLKNKNINLDKLITVDIVCHGVPSPGIWKNYIDVYQTKLGQPFTSLDFRDKQTNGWQAHIEKYTTAEGKTFNNNQWAQMYYRHIMFRDSCFACPYTTTERLSDFTIADYWEIGNNAPEFDDDKGCSLVLVHTDKAKKFFEDIKQVLHTKQTKIESSMQPQMIKPVWKGWDYGLFWKSYTKNPDKCIKNWFFPSKATLMFRECEKQAKKIIKKTLKLINR